MTGKTAWVLNFDAENELRSATDAPQSRETEARLPALVRALGDLVLPDDIVLGPSVRLTSEIARGYIGRAWCPTPRAIERIQRAGVVPAAAPALDVLRRVNHRRFGADLCQMLPGARYVTQKDELDAVIAGESPTGHWLLKRPFGFAGKGRRKVIRGVLESSAETWVAASLRDGDGLQVEPWVERSGDYALHGYITERREISWGEPTQQECDASGAWRETRSVTDLAPHERSALITATERAAAGLVSAGYLGPFGVDAFRYRMGETLAFNAQSEINARYSMGWAVGMRTRPDLGEH